MRQRVSKVWRRWVGLGVLSLSLSLCPGLAFAQADGDAVATTNTLSYVGNDPAVWLEEASVQARRVTGVGDQLTTALQLKGELLAEIAVLQEQLGEADSADRNQTLVRLCVRALQHGGDDGWVHAAQAKALSSAGDQAAADQALQQIQLPAEREIAELLIKDQASVVDTLSLDNSQISRGFASQIQTQSLRKETRTQARTFTTKGSAQDAAAWIETLEVPALQAIASIEVARVLIDAPPPATQTVGAEIPEERPVETPAVTAEVAEAGQPEKLPEPVAEPVTEVVVTEVEVESAPAPKALPETEVQVEAEIVATTKVVEPLETEVEVGSDVSQAVEAAGEQSVEAVEVVANDTVEFTESIDDAQSEQMVIEPEPAATETAEFSVEAPAIPVVIIAGGADAAEEAEDAPAAPPTSAVIEEDVNADTEVVAAESTETPAEVAQTEPTAQPETLSQAADASIDSPAQDSAVEITSPEMAAEDAIEAEAEVTAEAIETAAVLETANPPAADETSAEPVTPEITTPDESPITTAIVAPAAELLPTPTPEPRPDPAPQLIVPSLRVLAEPAQVLDDAPAPDVYDVKFITTKGPFVVRVHRGWAPAAADRFYDLARAGFYHNQRFFRVVPGFVAQWGIHGFPKVAAAWRPQTFPDEPRTQPNRRGTIVFAAAAQADTRTTQVFINLDDNAYLDDLGFAPFGEVTQGLDIVDQLFGGYGEAPSQKQRDVQLEGNALLDTLFPDLDSIVSVKVSTPE